MFAWGPARLACCLCSSPCMCLLLCFYQYFLVCVLNLADICPVVKVRFINFERTKLPEEILKHNLEEKRKYFSDVCLEVERSDAEVQVCSLFLSRALLSCRWHVICILIFHWNFYFPVISFFVSGGGGVQPKASESCCHSR